MFFCVETGISNISRYSADFSDRSIDITLQAKRKYFSLLLITGHGEVDWGCREP